MLAWHFLKEDRKLGYRDGRLVTRGCPLTHEGPLILCGSGLHASVRALDALKYATGPIATLVRLEGEIQSSDDKVVAQSRTCLEIADATEVLRAFARWCALQVASNWDCPPVVLEFLQTGREGLRKEARSAASSAASSAAYWAASSAADSAAYWAASSAASSAADSAAYSAASSAARSAAYWAADSAADSAASSAADWAASSAAQQAQNEKLEHLLLELFSSTVE